MKVHCFLLLTLCSFSLFAQQTFRGKIIEKSTGKPVEDICISLLRADSTTIAYTHADAKGTFDVACSSADKPAFLFISLMGYKVIRLVTHSFVNGSTIVVESAPLLIREVKVTSQRIRQDKDTLTYSVSGFRMPQDRSIADVLKKMPGIEVSGNGQIKFQDRPINKLYIEGMDLLGGKYALVTNNLSGKSVKEVQVFQRHQPIAALQGKSFTDQAALNLVLTDDAKMRMGGMVDLGAGYSDTPSKGLWDARLMTFFFGSHMQNFTLYKSNNAGNDIAGELFALTMSDLLERMRGVNDESDMLADATILVPDVDQARYLFNKSHLFATNHLWKPSKEKSVRVQLNGIHNQVEQKYSSSTIYKYPDNEVVVGEVQQINSQANSIDGELSFQQNSGKTYINNVLSGTLKFLKSDQSLSTNGSPISTRVRPERQVIKNNFEWIKNIEKRTYSLSSVNSYSYLPQSLLVAPGMYNELISDGKPADSFEQEATLHSFRSHTYTSFQHLVAGFYVKYKAGVQVQRQALQSQLLWMGEGRGNQSNNPAFGNNLTFFDMRTYIEPSIRYKDYKWTVSLDIPVSYRHYRLNYTLPVDKIKRDNKFIVEPLLQLTYDVSAQWSLQNKLSYSFTSADIHSLSAGYIFSSYRSTQAYSDNMAFDKRLDYSGTLSFSNPLSGFFASFSGNIMPTWRDKMYTRSNEGILTQIETREIKSQSLLWGVRSRVSKTWGWCKLFMGAGIGYTQAKDKQLLAEKIVSFHTDELAVNANVAIQPCRVVSVEARSSAYLSWLSISHTEGERSSISNYKHQLKINVFPFSKWKLGLDNMLYHSSTPISSSTYFADLCASFIHKSFEVEVSALNVFNTRSLEQSYFDGTVESHARYDFRPRQYMIKFMFSF